MSSPFLAALRDEMRLRGYSLRTEKTYIHWIVEPQGQPSILN
ncbi:MAG: hypothetical protein OEY38_22480 [Gammaproteobacteria bacterium]|nr:hypothetical protein [Gammaproteobacteria bacterium]